MSDHTPDCDWPADHMGACPERRLTHNVFDCNHWCSRHGGRANPATWDEPVTGGSDAEPDSVPATSAPEASS